jgi:hypothetical protein
MNLKEGTRRLALLLGVVGAIAGGFASYAELQTVLSQRARHNRFEQLAASDVVQQERKILKAWTPVQETPPKIDARTGERIQPNEQQTASPQQPQTDPYAAIAIPNPSDVNSGGIETINWSHDYGVASIKTEDGQTLYPTAAPSASLYLLILLFPLLGFILPWAAIRAIGWVGAGFVASTK